MLSQTVEIIWIVFQAIVGLILVFPVLSYLIYLFSKRKQPIKENNPEPEADYAILVTAYKDISNIPHVVQSLLKLDYSNYLIYVIADNCPEFEQDFDNERVIVLRPDPILENQVKSHFYAIDHFIRNHSRLTIIDSDNLVDSQYLNELNKSFDAGHQAVQGVRKAKNFDTHYACLDAANEIYYFFYNRKVLYAIGSSSMLAGSGMAFTVKLYRECLGQVASSGAGFDKILQKEIINRGYRIAFAEKAIVYDEKTSHPEQLVKQRARWNNTWFRYFNLGIYLMGQGIRNLGINRFLFGFLIIRPPLFLLLGLSFLIMGINFLVCPVAAIIWVFLLLIFVSGFFIALKKSDTDPRIYKSLIHIPRFVFFQLVSLLKTRKANQFSVATVHLHHKEIEKI
jgi:cellulose synthase/poly-beta-1,6-N-acetylglucosamine synthase-like glycosyltransferase